MLWVNISRISEAHFWKICGKMPLPVTSPGLTLSSGLTSAQYIAEHRNAYKKNHLIRERWMLQAQRHKMIFSSKPVRVIFVVYVVCDTFVLRVYLDSYWVVLKLCYTFISRNLCDFLRSIFTISVRVSIRVSIRTFLSYRTCIQPNIQPL